MAEYYTIQLIWDYHKVLAVCGVELQFPISLYYPLLRTVKSRFIVTRLNGESLHIKMKREILILATVIV